MTLLLVLSLGKVGGWKLRQTENQEYTKEILTINIFTMFFIHLLSGPKLCSLLKLQLHTDTTFCLLDKGDIYPLQKYC